MFLERGWAFVDGLPPLAFEWEEDAASEAFARVGSRSDSEEKPLICPVIDSTRTSSWRTHIVGGIARSGKLP